MEGKLGQSRTGYPVGPHQWEKKNRGVLGRMTTKEGPLSGTGSTGALERDRSGRCPALTVPFSRVAKRVCSDLRPGHLYSLQFLRTPAPAPRND